MTKKGLLPFRILDIIITYDKPILYRNIELIYSTLYGNTYSSRDSIHMGLHETLVKMLKKELVCHIGKFFRTYSVTPKGLEYYHKLRDSRYKDSLLKVLKK